MRHRTERRIDDARLVVEVARGFSRQFASYDAAVALGDWAIARWRGSGPSRGRFPEVAQVAADGQLRDRAVAASAPGFRARLEAALAEPVDGRHRGGRGAMPPGGHGRDRCDHRGVAGRSDAGPVAIGALPPCAPGNSDRVILALSSRSD